MPHTTPVHSPLMTAEEVADFARTTVRTLESMRVRGDGPPFIKRGRRVFYDRATVEAWALGRSFTSTAEVSTARQGEAHAGAGA